MAIYVLFLYRSRFPMSLALFLRILGTLKEGNYGQEEKFEAGYILTTGDEGALLGRIIKRHAGLGI